MHSIRALLQILHMIMHFVREHYYIVIVCLFGQISLKGIVGAFKSLGGLLISSEAVGHLQIPEFAIQTCSSNPLHRVI